MLNFKSWIKLIYDKITCTYCVINEFNPTFETQNMGHEAFKNASFGNGNEDYSCLWALTLKYVENKAVLQSPLIIQIHHKNSEHSTWFDCVLLPI